MAQKPTIYLGLGGTGNLAVSYAKKLYEEEYGKGNIPSSIAFVTVDFQTDMDESRLLATDIKEDFIKIKSQVNPRNHYQVRHEDYSEYSWMFKSNEANIGNLISRGASAVRTTGRLYTEMALEQVMNNLKNTVRRVKSFTSNSAAANEVMIYMVMSLAGGTGAGSFITIANAIKEEYGNNVTLYGYGVTHSVFKAMDPTGNIMPNVELNAISSILDLDYIYTLNSKSEPFKLEVGSRRTNLKDYLFDGFFVIDNTSDNGNVVTNIKDLCEVVGTCLYAYGGDAGNVIEATINNVGPKSGNYNVGGKLGWVQSVGACQVVYKGELLAKTYGLKAAQELIRKMVQVDANIDANPWSQEVGIREDGTQFNMLTDRICSPNTIQSLSIPLLDNQQSDELNKDCVKEYLGTLEKFPSQAYIDKISEDLKNALDNKIETFLKSENGIGNSLAFLKSLKDLCNTWKGEMIDESKELSKEKDKISLNFLQQSFDTYNQEKHGKWVYRGKERNQELLEEFVAIPAKEILQKTYEIERRKAAENIYVSLIAKIDSLKIILKDINKQLTNLSDKYGTDLAKLQGINSDALIFEYDLSFNERKNMTIDSNNILVTDFISALDKSLLEIDVKTELNDCVLKYTSSLPQANAYKNKILTQVIDSLPLSEYNELKREIEKKSARWLVVNGRGQSVSSGMSVDDSLAKNWVVSVYQPNEGYKSRLENDVNFLRDVNGKQFLPVDKDVAKQRMIFCRIDGSIIPYCINAFNDNVIERYNKHINRNLSGDMVFNPHFDRHIFEKMRQEDFKLKPEMKNEAIFYWVCGQLFGWEKIKEEERVMNKDENGNAISEGSREMAEHLKYISCIRKKYMFWDKEAISGKDKQWKPLGDTTKRDIAFNYFKTTILPEHRDQFKELISQTYSMKRAFWDSEIQRIISDGIEDYIDRIVCSDKNSVTYFANNSGETELLQKEFQYIKDSLLKTLANFK